MIFFLFVYFRSANSHLKDWRISSLSVLEILFVIYAFKIEVLNLSRKMLNKKYITAFYQELYAFGSGRASFYVFLRGFVVKHERSERPEANYLLKRVNYHKELLKETDEVRALM